MVSQKKKDDRTMLILILCVIGIILICINPALLIFLSLPLAFVYLWFKVLYDN